LPGGDFGPAHESLKVRPRHRQRHTLDEIRLREAAIGSGDHVFPAHQPREPQDPVRGQAGCSTATVGRFNRIGLGADLQNQAHDLIGRGVAQVRDAPAPEAQVMSDALFAVQPARLS